MQLIIIKNNTIVWLLLTRERLTFISEHKAGRTSSNAVRDNKTWPVFFVIPSRSVTSPYQQANAMQNALIMPGAIVLPIKLFHEALLKEHIVKE